MTIKTLSQFPRIKDISDSASLLEMSVPLSNNSNLYASKSVSFLTISDNIVSSAVLTVSDVFNMTLSSDGTKANVKQLNQAVDNLYNANTTVAGLKTFTTRIRFNDGLTTENLNSNDAATINDINNIVHSSASYIGNGSYLRKNPLLNGGIDAIGSHFTDDNSSDMLYFHIEHGGYDSSMTTDEFVKSHSNTVCNHTGQLIMYGWLAQLGEVEPQNAWVALCGKIKVGANDQWVILQLQPWHVNANSTRMQYVSFNLNVRIGLPLKIVTGFNVDGNNSGFLTGNSLGFRNNTPNTFVGYIIGDINER